MDKVFLKFNNYIMEIIRKFFDQLQNIYITFEYYIDRLPSSEVGFWFFYFWIWGGVASILYFVFVIVQHRIRLMMGWTSKSEKLQLQNGILAYPEALLLVRQPHMPGFSVGLAYFNFFSFFLMGWVSFLYFIFMLITKRHLKPVFTQFDLVIWKKVDLFTTYIAGLLLVVFIILLIVL